MDGRAVAFGRCGRATVCSVVVVLLTRKVLLLGVTDAKCHQCCRVCIWALLTCFTCGFVCHLRYAAIASHVEFTKTSGKSVPFQQTVPGDIRPLDLANNVAQVRSCIVALHAGGVYAGGGGAVPPHYVEQYHRCTPPQEFTTLLLLKIVERD